MSQFKMVLLLLTVFSSHAFADSIFSLYSCQQALIEDGFSRGVFFGEIKSPIQVVSKSVTNKDFLVFTSQNIYRCQIPKEGLMSYFSSCQHSDELSTSYNVEMKLGYQSIPANFQVSKAQPYNMLSAQSWFYRSSIPRDYKFCNMTCKEELGEETQKQVVEHLNDIVRTAAQRMKASVANNTMARSRECSDLSRSVSRLISKYTQSAYPSEIDCRNEVERKGQKLEAELSKKLKNTLNHCGGELREAAAEQLKTLDRNIVAEGNRPNGDDYRTSATAR